ncbi:MAG: sodium:proton antiporter [Lachnospiraceae bacterium]|nr:sodium:proton antiporter [Lachnospiraceae bacterium]
MLTSLALIFLLGLLAGLIFQKLKLPSLLGMILVGMAVSPYAFNLLDASILSIAGDLRRLALVIILTRAGLSLNVADLKKVGRPAVLMCFVPACFEMLAVIFIAPKVLPMSTLDAAIMGSVIAAVSPAVIVPRMIKLMEDGYGTDKSIPQLILAGASVDDVFVIVVFTAFTGLAQTGKLNVMSFLTIPVSIVLGILAGIVSGLVVSSLLKRLPMRDTAKLLVVLSISFLLLECETRLEGIIPMSGLLAIMSMGILIRQKEKKMAESLAGQYNALWGAAEVLLFVLVGATVDLNYALQSGLAAVLIVAFALLVRMAGVYVCLLKTELSGRERMFCMFAYMPKATVQAAIGAIPLSMGLACGNQVLTVAVLAILITAPFGAILVDKTYQKLLTKRS